MKLVIGNKNYSSWSLRPWLLLQHFQQPFEEQQIHLGAADIRAQMAPFCPNYKVPVLLDGSLTVWDSLAICEYINEQYLDSAAWPEDIGQRARARAVCAEMHAGFSHLRSSLPMNCRRIPAAVECCDGVQTDIKRIIEIWQQCLSLNADSRREQAHFLFGQFSIADAMFMPVVSRFYSYQVSVPADVRQYMDHMLNLPAYQLWLKAAVNESETIAAAEV
ncbi:glutathione S-transferase family protein [Thalassomonas actiniarum]|uniref:Glutathione S-transferase family protein n=2 Tax=Thalassomonas actiniarum TaxID=485447 RepID=A0AAF0C5S9_9GAMM|nr:glutathione S-transferase family protein [Thalassomonas actiniarum]